MLQSRAGHRSFRLGTRISYVWRRHSHELPKRGPPPLPTKPVRTRFAPSPTGYLHLGSLRTALFNYLLARKTGGQFLLRIEDTDQKRTVPGAEARLFEDLRWAGLDWDEGPEIGGPHESYRQSERTPLYQEHAQKLVDSGHAYRCFCSSEKLEDLARRRRLLDLPTDYDRTCAGISKEESEDRAAKGEKHVVRLLSPNEYPEYYDLVYDWVGGGKRGTRPGVLYKHGEQTFEDPILLKSNGTPTYHLANVVDDHHMKISHVIRATEWMPSTPKHLALYRAFGWKPPQFAHVGLLVDVQGHKLSKRNMDTDIGVYRDKYGILSTTMVNFVALMGWSHKQKSDLMDLEELINAFEMRFTRGNATVALEKLWFIQRFHASKLIENNEAELNTIVAKVVDEARKRFGLEEAINGRRLDGYVRTLVRADSRNYESPELFLERNVYFFEEPQPPQWPPRDPREYRAYREGFEVSTTQLDRCCQRVLKHCENDWSQLKINAAVEGEVTALLADVIPHPPAAGDADSEEDVLKKAKSQHKMINVLLHEYMRHRLLDGRSGPGITSTMHILGYDICKKRLPI